MKSLRLALVGFAGLGLGMTPAQAQECTTNAEFVLCRLRARQAEPPAANQELNFPMAECLSRIRSAWLTRRLAHGPWWRAPRTASAPWPIGLVWRCPRWAPLASAFRKGSCVRLARLVLPDGAAWIFPRWRNPRWPICGAQAARPSIAFRMPCEGSPTRPRGPTALASTRATLAAGPRVVARARVLVCPMGESPTPADQMRVLSRQHRIRAISQQRKQARLVALLADAARPLCPGACSPAW
jgi:hypothetical protein